MTTMASQITSLTVVYSIIYSGADQRKHQSSASLAFVQGIHGDRWIPRTKGQLRGKCFHLMTSSCAGHFLHVFSRKWPETPNLTRFTKSKWRQKEENKQRVLMQGHQGWNVRHGLCHNYMRYVYIYELFIAFFCCCCLFIIVTWWYVWCIVWASGNQEEVQAWSLKKHPHSMRLKSFMKMCIFVVVQIL